MVYPLVTVVVKRKRKHIGAVVLEYNMNIHKIQMMSPNLGGGNVIYFGIMGPSQIFYHIEVSDRTRKLIKQGSNLIIMRHFVKARMSIVQLKISLGK